MTLARRPAIAAILGALFLVGGATTWSSFVAFLGGSLALTDSTA
jgi:hypothetical protein